MDQTSIQALFYGAANWLVNAIPNLIAAIFILVIGYFIARWVASLIRSVLSARPHVDQTLTPVIATMARYFIQIITFIAVLGQLGVQIASMLAVLGAAGLAIGLALQGTLSNIAAGLMLLWLRPFRAGDSIEAKDIKGTVTEVGLFASTLRTYDGLYYFVPNSSLWNTPIVNTSRNASRRVSVEFLIPKDEDLDRASQLLLDAANSEGKVLQDPKPRVLATAVGESNTTLALQFWTSPPDFLAARSTVIEKAKRDLRGVEA